MKKIKLTTTVRDKETGEMLGKGSEVERPEKRAKQFVDRGVAEYVEEKKAEAKKAEKKEPESKSKKSKK